MMWNNATITDAGNALLSRWAGGGLLTITGAAAGTGFVNATALAKLTELVELKQWGSIVNYAAGESGIQYTIRLTAADESYIANQIGIFAKLDGGGETLIAVYQDETGIPIPGRNEMADFMYAFYATIQMNNGPIEVLIDQQSAISREDAQQMIKESALRYNEAQELTEEQKQTARENMGLHKAAHTGSYKDLTDTPEIPEGVTVDESLSATSTNPVQNKAVKAELDKKAPTSHAVNTTTYGKGTSTYYGHVKLSDSTNSTSSTSGGVAATPAAVKEAYDLAKGKADGNHTHAAEDITGLKQVAKSGSYNDLSDKPTIPEGAVVDSALSSTSANPVQNKVVKAALDGKSPTSHRSTATTYGAATASYYGHVKLSDAVDSTSGVSSGVAATPSAVKEAYDLAAGKADKDHTHTGYAPSSHSHPASQVTAGTLAGKTQANASAMATLSDPQVRDIKAGTTDLTPGTSTLATGSLYFVYE